MAHLRKTTMPTEDLQALERKAAEREEKSDCADHPTAAAGC
jgi:hypothetical protein